MHHKLKKILSMKTFLTSIRENVTKFLAKMFDYGYQLKDISSRGSKTR